MKSRDYLTTLLWTLPVLLQAVILLPRPANNLESGGGGGGANWSEWKQCGGGDWGGSNRSFTTLRGYCAYYEQLRLSSEDESEDWNELQTATSEGLNSAKSTIRHGSLMTFYWFFPLTGSVLRFLEIFWDSFLTLLPIQKAFKTFVCSLLNKRIQSWILDLPSFGKESKKSLVRSQKAEPTRSVREQHPLWHHRG